MKHIFRAALAFIVVPVLGLAILVGIPLAWLLQNIPLTERYYRKYGSEAGQWIFLQH
jgi:hypothetical protein